MTVFALALTLISCGLSGGEAATPVPTAEISTPDLLPPPTETEVAATVTEPAPTQAVSETETPADPTAAVEVEPASILSCLSKRAQIAQLLLPLVTQPEIAGAQAFAADGELGGIGLLGSPDEGLKPALEALQQTSFVPIMVASDEEGGTVQRLADLLGPIPSNAVNAQSKTPEDVQRQWVEYGSRVKALGIDVVFGPVVDVGSGPGIESRSFGDDPALVTTYGRAVADGLIEAGILPVLKHFPGHGRATADSHLELPTTPSVEELRSYDLIPYVQILADPSYAERSGVMIGHLAVPGLSDATPTSLSPATISGLLQTEIGFNGLVFADAMNMGAIVNTYGRLEALELTLLAGTDIAILGSLADLTPALDYLEQRANEDPIFGAVIENRATRVLIAKGQSELCVGAR